MEDVQKLEGYVALIDVLGFRELVGKDDGLNQVRSYIETVITALETTKTSSSPLQFVLFSDNLVINTKDDSDASFEDIVKACSVLSYQLSQKRIAVRGAIAYGAFMRSPTTRQGVILAGRPIVEANHYQHLQNWIGIILSPSVVSHFGTLDDKCSMRKPNPGENEYDWAKELSMALRLQRYRTIPFHKTAPHDHGAYDGYAVVPLSADVCTLHMYKEAINSLAKQLGTMKLAAPDPISQEKYDLTLDWLIQVKKGF